MLKRSLQFKDTDLNSASLRLGLSMMKRMEKAGMVWDLAREVPSVQHLKSTVTFPSVSICQRNMLKHETLSNTLQMRVHSVLYVGLSRFTSGHWWQCFYTSVKASMLYLILPTDHLQEETNICELAGSIMCPPDNTARTKHSSDFSLLKWHICFKKKSFEIQKNCAILLMTVPAFPG